MYLLIYTNLSLSSPNLFNSYYSYYPRYSNYLLLYFIIFTSKNSNINFNSSGLLSIRSYILENLITIIGPFIF